MGVSSIMKAADDDWVITVDNGNFIRVTAPNQSHLTIKAATKDCNNIYEVQSKINELNKLTSEAMEEAIYHIDDDEAMREMEANRPKYVPANNLPEGWNWEQYNDGSGGLYGPDGEDYFHYDLATVPGGVEYMQTSKHPWDAFYGSFSEFKEYAETVVNSLYIVKTVEKEAVQHQKSIQISESTPDNENTPKYRLTDDVISLDDTEGAELPRILHRIQALKDFRTIDGTEIHAGDLGGYIEKEANLSQYDNCWVVDKAKVYNDARVLEDALICGTAEVRIDATVFGSARVYDNAIVTGEATVLGTVYNNAYVTDSAEICSNAKVYGNALISGAASVYDTAEVYGKARIGGFAKVCGEAKVYDSAKVYDYAYICDNAVINGSAEICGDTVVNNNIQISAGKINSTPKWSVTDNIKESGYKPTKKLVACMEKVNDAAGKKCSVRNLKDVVKKQPGNEELKKAATVALRELNRQERCSALAQALHLPVK